MLPATKLDNLSPPRGAARRPVVINGTRPALNIVRLEFAMEALEGYVDSHLADLEAVDKIPSTHSDA